MKYSHPPISITPPDTASHNEAPEKSTTPHTPSPFQFAGKLAALASKITRNNQKPRAESQQIIQKRLGKERYSISTESDFAIEHGARVHARARKIETDNRFYFNKEIFINEDDIYIINEKPAKYKSKKEFGIPINYADKPLSKINLTSRLDLHGHGNIDNFSELTAEDLARALYNAGLTEVGIIKLHACNVGKEYFLIDFKKELNKLKIKVGYISGPTGIAVDWRVEARILNHEFSIHCLPFKTVGFLIPEKYRLRVIKGNIDIAFPSTRYDLPIPELASRPHAEKNLSNAKIEENL